MSTLIGFGAGAVAGYIASNLMEKACECQTEEESEIQPMPGEPGGPLPGPTKPPEFGPKKTGVVDVSFDGWGDEFDSFNGRRLRLKAPRGIDDIGRRLGARRRRRIRFQRKGILRGHPIATGPTAQAVYKMPCEKGSKTAVGTGSSIPEAQADCARKLEKSASFDGFYPADWADHDQSNWQACGNYNNCGGCAGCPGCAGMMNIGGHDRNQIEWHRSGEW